MSAPPPPWSAAKDPTSGNTYYYNTQTGVVQWTMPAGPAAPPPRPTMSAPPSRFGQAPPNYSSAPQQSAYNNVQNHVMEARRVAAASGPSYGGGGGGGGYGMNGGGGGGGNYQNGGGGMRNGVKRGTDLDSLVKDDASPPEVMAWRAKHEVSVAGGCDECYETFEAAPLPPRLLAQLKAAGFAAPSAIQGQAWPPALAERDVIGVAKTGSGKTLGFLVPAIKLLCGNNPYPMPGQPNAPRVLVLAPTRELATQIADETLKFARPLGVQCVCCYGGAPKGPQLGDLRRGAHVCIATPGRLNDFLEMGQVSMHNVNYLVFDEADRMLDMGFEPQIRKVVARCPPSRQTLFFTATWPREVRALASEFLAAPVIIYVGDQSGKLKANKDIKQVVMMVSGPPAKDRALVEIIRRESSAPGCHRIIVFANAKRMCDTLERSLPRMLQVRCAAIHGDKDQHQRTATLNAFKAGICPVLIATDVAARGLDIMDVRAVVNYDMANDIESYVHRIGRTARAGAKGTAYTFFTSRDGRKAAPLLKLMEEAGTDPANIPDELRQMSGGGGFGASTMQFSSGGGRDRSGSRDRGRRRRDRSRS